MTFRVKLGSADGDPFEQEETPRRKLDLSYEEKFRELVLLWGTSSPNARRGRYACYVSHPRKDAGFECFEWNAHSPNSRHHSSNGSPQCAALDLPPRRVGLYSARLLDSSVIPLPGSMDVLTIILSARKQELWLYYALMATIGSVIGGYVTYRLARKGGKYTLGRTFWA